MRLIGRVFLLALGLALAIPFGVVTLAIGVGLEPAARELVGALGVATLWSILADLFAGEPPDARAVALFTAFATGVAAILIAPPMSVAAIGEVLGWRALLWYAGGSGALDGAPALARPRPRRHGARNGSRVAGRGPDHADPVPTGAASGLVYWAIAGRRRWRCWPRSRRRAERPLPSQVALPRPDKLHHRVGDAVDAAAAELLAADVLDRLGDLVAARAGAARACGRGFGLPRRAPPAPCCRSRRRGSRCCTAGSRTRRRHRSPWAAWRRGFLPSRATS